MKKGLISKVQRYSINDGPGIRSTVFLKGCNLNCMWCSNPELIDFSQSYLDGKPVGELISVKDVVKEVIRDIDFYKESLGGVTFSGGEPLLQSDFLLECIKLLKDYSIHIAIDTALYVDKKIIKKLLPYVDLWLVDLKSIDDITHIKTTNVSNKIILDNIKFLYENNVNMWIRCILVNKENYDLDELKKRLNFIEDIKECVKRVDILGYHQLGVSKYQKLNKEYLLTNEALLSDIQEKEVEELIKEYVLPIYFERGI